MTRLLCALALITLLYVIAAQAMSGVQISGTLQPCESRETEAGCFTLSGAIYLQLSPDLKRTTAILSALTGREVTLTIQPQ